MSKKSIASEADVTGVNDVRPTGDAVKFISKFADYHFLMPVLDKDGKTETHADANGNARVPTYKEYHFTSVRAHRGKDGKIDPDTAFSFFIVDRNVHGDDYDRLLKKLTRDTTNPINQIFTEDKYFEIRNPEAFRIAKEKSELEAERDEFKRRAEELEKRLGLKK